MGPPREIAAALGTTYREMTLPEALTRSRFDIVAIGGGTAGLVTAAGAATLGLRAALIEREALGGDCLWTGCVPSKALIASARLAHAMRHADRLGLAGATPAHVLHQVMDRMRRAREQVAHHDDPARFRGMGVEVAFGTARVTRPDRVEVNGNLLRTKHIVVATGSHPTAPDVPGLAAAGFLTHVTAFEQNALPARIAILGGGPIGLEFAQIYRRLGAEVVLFEMLPRLLPREDPEASAVLLECLRAEGVTVHVDCAIERVEPRPGGRHRLEARAGDGEAIAEDVDAIFVATGRRANGEGLGLEGVGVALERGAVAVDGTLRSTVPTIWAAGDVSGGLQFTHVADYQAKLVLRNILSPVRAAARYDAVPWVTYTDPEVARVGLTEDEARERHGAITVYRYPFAELDRAITDGATEGFVKIVTGRGARILGATIVGHGAGELLPSIVLMMREGLPVSRLSQFIWAYPTMAEGVKRAADTYYRRALTGWKGALLRKAARWLV